LSETLARGLQELRAALEAYQKQLLEVTGEVANEDVQCLSLHYDDSVIHVVRTG